MFNVPLKQIAKRKMSQMVRQGLQAYFSHKVEEYGVYFFDPFYYESVEPFHANLRSVVSVHQVFYNSIRVHI